MSNDPGRKRLVPLILTALFFLAFSSDEPPSGWTPELALQVKRVGDVQISPDGKHAAFVVGKAVMEGEKSEWVSQIHLADLSTGRSFQLTQGEKSSSSPRWSPDGAWIAFLSSRDSQSRNLWRIRVAGGEAERMTDEKASITGFSWSPDGSQIAFVMTAAPTEEQEKNRKGKNDFRWVDEDFRMADLYVLPVGSSGEKTEKRMLTKGEYEVGGGFGGGVDWSPDGTRIAFTHTPTPLVDDWTRADLSVVDLRSGAIGKVAHTGAAESQPFFSPDGKWLAYTTTDDPASWAFMARVQIKDLATGELRQLAPTHDQNPNLIGWSQDGSGLYFTETYRTVDRVWMLPVDGSAPQEVSPDGVMVGDASLNSSGLVMGFVHEAPDRVPEPYWSRIDSFAPQQVAQVQELPELPIGKTDVVRWKSKDGREVEGLLTYPVGYSPGQKVPLVVVVHGGPTGVFVQSFIGQRGAYPIGAFANEGYAVLRCNVRGSSGYGKEFRFANYGDWGGGDYQDIMSGVDHVIEMGVADPDRLGVMGWSYGGYMTSWVITQTDRFKAASVGAGVTNLMSFTGTADIQGFIPDYFGGDYWDVFDKWAAHSAMFNVKGVKTPTLIQHGEEDARVPVTQGYELYHALKRQGVTTRMVVYPRQPHGIQEPKLQLAAMKQNLEWFNQWLKGQ